MTAFRVQAKRTTASGPPADLEFGELAYSDADQQFYIGRADSEQPPSTFEGTPTDYREAIADLTNDLATLDTSQTAQENAIAAITVEQGTQSAAIADLTTDLATLDTSQTAQENAIALLSAASDSQGDALASLATYTQGALADKANDADLATVSKTGAYSDLTGLPTLFSGAYADLTGLPTLFSGAYADLSGTPTIPAGFTYDQQSEPVGPVAGATWRERASGGLIVNDWEWLGSVWASLHRTTLSGSNVNGAATTYPTVPFEAPRCLFTQCRIAVTQQGNPATPFNATNYRELFLARSLTNAASAVFTFRPLISLAQGAYISPMNYLNPAGAFFFSGTTIVGTPGTMHAPSVSWVYREVRA